MAGEAGQSFVVLKDLGENQCVVLGRNSVQGDAVAVPEVVFFPAGSGGGAIQVKSSCELICTTKNDMNHSL